MPSNQLFEQLKSKILRIENQKLLEKIYYEELSICLKSGQFEGFRILFNASVEFNIFMDVKKIPNRFNIISELLLICTDKISTGYQTSALGEIIDILRFFNEHNLLEKEITEFERQKLRHLKEDKLFMANLNDLFGKVSNSFISYVYEIMPRDLYNYFIKSPISYFPNHDGLMHFIKNIFFDQYTIYGLSIRYLSPIDNFINIFKKNFLFNNNHFEKQKDQFPTKAKELLEFDVIYKYRIYYYDTEEEHEHREIKKHLVSPRNISKNLEKILDKDNYNFYSLSMVLLGGLGPQGLGFTYSTPKGEVIEICSDISQNKAIIIKFKEFLKKQFIKKLQTELLKFSIKVNTINRLIDFLVESLSKEELINYHNKEVILKKVKNFLVDDIDHRYVFKNEFHELIDKISDAISAILRPIKMIDQYKVRMNLIVEGKLKSEDIAKLTSLKEKSHYDVLRERFFFQYIVNWFYEIYRNKEIKNGDKKNMK